MIRLALQLISDKKISILTKITGEYAYVSMYSLVYKYY